jgi:NAD+ kinase
MIKAYIVSYPSSRSKKIIKILKKKIEFTTLKKSKLIIVIGGDGFMLQTLKKLYKHKTPFYGINSGDYGFLMNKFSKINFYNDILKSKKISISPLVMKVISRNKTKKEAIAINEVSILRQSRQAASLSIKVNKKYLIKKLRGDGILVSTPAGSTAYNLSVHGPILNLNSNKLVVSPVSPFRPRRWKGKIVKDNSIIIIRNLNSIKRPVSAVADNIEVRNAKLIKITINKKVKFKLLYDKNRSLQKKIKIEQIRKEIN